MMLSNLEARRPKNRRPPVRLPWPIVDPHKVRDYLLSPTHPVGRFKAAYFAKLGYGQGDWLRLQRDLMAIGSGAAASKRASTGHCDVYDVSAILQGPSGRSAPVRTVWLVRHGEASARFITAYPDDKP
jgi:hypothetical protein